MKTIGILGGLGPEATIDYYNQIIDVFKQVNRGKLAYPEIVIYSVNMDHFIGLLEKGAFEDASNYLATCLNKIQAAGADFGVISANTPHLLFEQIQSKTELKLLSIVEACAQEAANMELKRCLLIGTKFTMKNQFYQKVFRQYDIDVICPTDSQIEQINHILFAELELGIINQVSKKLILELISEIKGINTIDSVILGCTEFPLMFREPHYLGIPFLNTTEIHVKAIVKKLREQN